jgi:flagellar protein FliL
MAEAQTEAPSGSKKTIIVFAVVLLLAISASIGGTLYFLSDPEEVTETEAIADSKPEKAVYHTLRPAFIVNYSTGGKPRFLQAELTVMSRDPAVVEAIITHMPLIRSQIVTFLADQDIFELQTHEGKEQLREGLRVLIDNVLSREEERSGVQSVLLTSFVMQ